jgi:hypothetical protein
MVIYLRSDLGEYLSKYAKEIGGLKASLKKDMENKVILEHLQLLGLIGKVITGPWMTLFYSEESNNLDLCGPIQESVAFVSRLVAEPGLLLSTTTTCFGDPFPTDDAVHTALINFGELNTDAAQKVFEEILKVLKNQLGRYIDGEFSSHEKELGSSVPMHNMESERILGMTDAHVRRAPNASLDYIQAKVKASNNKSLVWLNSLEGSKQADIVTFSRKQARLSSATHRSHEKSTTDEVIRRMRATAQTRDDKSRGALQRQLNSLQGTVTEEQLCSLATVPVNLDSLEFALGLMNTPDDMVGVKFVQKWCIEDDSEEVEWSGEVVEVKRSRPRGKKANPKKLDFIINSRAKEKKTTTMCYIVQIWLQTSSEGICTSNCYVHYTCLFIFFLFFLINLCRALSIFFVVILVCDPYIHLQ